MVVSGFAQIQAQLQYRASGGSIGLPVVVGTSRGGGGGGGPGPESIYAIVLAR